MRFFNLINFSTLLPTITPKSLSPAITLSTPITNNSLSYFDQNQNAQTLDFNFNNLITNPEALFLQQTPTGITTNHSPSSLYVNYTDYEVFTYPSLELFNSINTTNLNTNEA
jgi:hypothetical protein